MESSTAVESTSSNENEFSHQNEISNPLSKLEEVENGDFSGLITQKMLNEERLLEEKAVLEEEKLRQKILEKEKSFQLKKKEEEEKCFKRLRLLLSQSSIYVQFMADTLKEHEEKEKMEKERLNSKKTNRLNRGVKRKAEDELPKRKKASGVTMLNVFKKESMEHMEFNEAEKSILEAQPSLLYGAIMRPYQLDGFNWLKTLFENAVNAILADEMGLGKTIQCIALIAYLVEMGVPGPFFICGPLSTVPNWCEEFQRFAPDIPVLMYHGDKVERQNLRQKILKKVHFGKFSCHPVVITSYQIALNDTPFLKRMHWKILVVDEAHRIKNFQCKLVEALKQYNASHRLLLTGTPLQNDLTELWSLLNFILPEIFNDLQVFESWFDINRLTQKSGTLEIIAQEQEKSIVSIIHQILTPFLLRRIKADVELDLPSKKEIIVHAPLTSLQREYYTSALNHTIRTYFHAEAPCDVIKFKDLPKRKPIKASYFGCENVNSFDRQLPGSEENYNPNVGFSELNLKLGTYQMCLRKICGHPYMVSYPLDPLTNDYLVDENIVKTSGKLLVLDQMLPKLKERGHKVLLFSQFVTMLEVLQDYCMFRNYKFCVLHGSISLADRQKAVKDFNSDESIFLFLISTKAGGLGINLTAADTVIVYDSDWNPQGDLQAQDRCHRIGQTKPVVVYRLVVPNTIDERVVELATAKRKLEKVIIKKGRFASSKGLVKEHMGISEEELLELLQSVDSQGFVKTDENNVLSPEELERLLDRRDLLKKSR